MYLKIYQINMDKDINKVKFSSLDRLERYQGSEKVDESIYKNVFCGDVDVNNPEEVFVMFNFGGHPLYNGHSLSVSDIVIMEGKALYCDRTGFQKVDFDESKVPKQDDLLRIVYVEPNKPAYESEIPDTLEALQKAVGGGLIEHFYTENRTCWIGNDEAKLIGMEGNRHYGNGGVIAGPFFICGNGGTEFCSLTDEQVATYLEKFAIPEDISDEEVQADSGITFISF